MASLPSPQRAFPRHAVEADVTLRVDGAVVARGKTRNLSRGGLCAIVDRAVARGAAVEVSVALVFSADGMSEPLALPARVVWCMGYGVGEQVGVSFLPLDRATSGYLDMFIRFLAGRDDERAEPRDPFDDQ